MRTVSWQHQPFQGIRKNFFGLRVIFLLTLGAFTAIADSIATAAPQTVCKGMFSGILVGCGISRTIYINMAFNNSSKRLERHAQNSIDSCYNKWNSSLQVRWQSSATGMAAIALVGLTEINVQWQPGWFRELIYTWLDFVLPAFIMKRICSVDVDNFFVRDFCRSPLLIIKTSFNVNTEVCFMFICKMSVTPFKIAWLI